MGSTIQPLRTCLRACIRAPPPRRTLTATSSARVRSRLSPQSQSAQRRRFTATPRRPKLHEEEYQPGTFEPLTENDERSIEELKRVWDKMTPEQRQNMDKMITSAESGARAAAAPGKINLKKAFWNEDEDDPDLITDEQDEDTFEEDDILGPANAKFEEYREYREYARLAAWEMPLLSKLARPFEAPAIDQPLRFRYTTYMGEFHPAESKVVVEFCPKDLPLTEAEQLKVMKLLGPRYNPETEIAKMSCEQFEHQAQNKRYLGDLVQSLIKKARDPTDMFEDIPLYTGHHKSKQKPRFPVEWRMTEERRKELTAIRNKAQLEDKAREEAGTLVDGPARIQQFLGQPPQPAMAMRLESARR